MAVSDLTVGMFFNAIQEEIEACWEQQNLQHYGITISSSPSFEPSRMMWPFHTARAYESPLAFFCRRPCQVELGISAALRSAICNEGVNRVISVETYKANLQGSRSKSYYRACSRACSSQLKLKQELDRCSIS
eukprot:TRINITY_DN112166_c0_g1_i1.p1 TRINITY_DN112166_c0_g1~~TRINITY_DN112166_c0_g1_i1.p1  ORF type:complete len:146 (+),score=11.67 TRINITY_DN112166_c0_g1_i1:42-440(+)